MPFVQSQRYRKSSLFRLALVFAMGSALAACGLAGSAPTSVQLESSVNNADFPFHLVRMDARVVSVLQAQRPVTFSTGFRTARYAASNALRAGDVVAVTVYETGGSTLFPPPQMGGVSFSTTPSAPNTAPAGGSTIPPQVVEADGTINVPFVGRISVTGKTPGQVARQIEQDLAGKAVQPQVLVTLVNNATNTATVGGDVNAPKPVPLSLRGERLLDVIAAAGGAKFAAYETHVEVVRGNQTGRVLLQTAVRNPADNIIIRPNDQVYLTRIPRSFAVMGAAQKVAQYPFETEHVTLAEAIARGGGPVDIIGDVSGIYLFRFEPLPVARAILQAEDVALSAYGADVKVAAADVKVVSQPEYVPVLYHIGLADAGGYFYAQSIQMRDKDVVLITNAESTQLQKLVNLVRGFSAIANDIHRITR